MNRSTEPVAVMCFSSGTGGMERSAVRLAGFLSLITDVILVCKQGSFTEELYHREGGDYKCETIRFVSRTFSPSMLVNASSIITRHNIKNVIFFGASELKTLYFAFLGHDINLVVWHGTTKSRPKHDFIHRLVYSRVNYHVAISQHLGNNVRKIVPPTKDVEFKVIYPSFRIDVSQKSVNHAATHEKLRLVHIGRVAAGKGQVDAVKACSTLHAMGIDFELDLLGSAGDDNYSRELNTTIENAPYADSINLLGFVENPQSYLQRADIFLFPSFGEGMPNAFIEALHYGIPCMAYDNTVFPEFITMGFHVTLAADRDHVDLADKLLVMVKQIDNEKQASSANAGLASEYFNVQRELASWQEILI